jgi:hypothetical protein
VSKAQEVIFCGGPWDGQRKTLDEIAIFSRFLTVAECIGNDKPWDLEQPINNVIRTGTYKPLKGQTKQWYWQGD